MRLKNLNTGPFVIFFLWAASWVVVVFVILGGMGLYEKFFKERREISSFGAGQPLTAMNRSYDNVAVPAKTPADLSEPNGELAINPFRFRDINQNGLFGPDEVIWEAGRIGSSEKDLAEDFDQMQSWTWHPEGLLISSPSTDLPWDNRPDRVLTPVKKSTTVKNNGSWHNVSEIDLPFLM